MQHFPPNSTFNYNELTLLQGMNLNKWGKRVKVSPDKNSDLHSAIYGSVIVEIHSQQNLPHRCTVSILKKRKFRFAQWK